MIFEKDTGGHGIMKKIAFFSNKFIAGGLEKSLLELIDIIDHDQYEVTVFLTNNDGEWTHLLEKKARVVTLQQEDFKFLVKNHLKNFDLISLLKTLILRIKAIILSKNNYYDGLKYRTKSMTKYPEQFDIAIAYQALDANTVVNCLHRINASKKVLWVHQSFTIFNPGFNNWYSDFDKVFCVSQYLKTEVQTMFPELIGKTDIFYNITNPSLIKELADEHQLELRKFESQIVLVTVGRISEEKGQSVIPQIAHLLVEKGYNFIWYLVGDGPLEKELQKKIVQYCVGDNVVLCGRKDNPYPYIKNCDIYVQTSKTEGWGLTVSEAKILNKPIVTTDSGVMSEQIETGVNGIITENDSAEEICNAIESLILNPDLRKVFIETLEKEDANNNKKQIQKLYSLIE